MEEYWQKVLDKKRQGQERGAERRRAQIQDCDDLARRIRQCDRTLTKRELIRATHWQKTATRQTLTDVIGMAHHLLRERFPTRKQKRKQKKKWNKHQRKNRASKSWRDPLTGRIDYEAYLKSPEWRETKKRAYEYHGDKCLICNRPARDMDHLTYERLGNERMEDLQPLCRECHNNKHEGGAYGCVDPMTQAFAELVKSF